MKKLQSILFIVLMAAVLAVTLHVAVAPVMGVLVLGYTVLNMGFNSRGLLGDFIVIADTDTQEVKQGKEALNKAFKQVDEDGKKALGDMKKAFDDQSKGLRDESETLKKALAELKDSAEASGKSYGDQIKELKDTLTDIARNKAKQDEDRRKSFRDNIAEQLEGKQDDITKYLANKSSGLSYEMKAVTAMGVITNSVPAEYAATQGLPHNLTHARDYIPVSPTNSNLIRYLRFTAKEGNVGVVTAGSAKPKKDYNQTVVDAAVIKLAGLVDVHDEFLEDVEGSRAWLSDELIKSLFDVEDLQVFKGSGNGNLAGLYTNAAALTLPYAGVATTANNIEKIAAAFTYVNRLKRMATAGFTSPEDMLAMYLNKGNTLEYTYPLQFDAQTGQLTILGKPVIAHNVFIPGEALVGDFNQGCRLFQKTGLTLSFSTENNDNFEKNVTTARVEERITLANFYPDSFVKVALTGASS